MTSSFLCKCMCSGIWPIKLLPLYLSSTHHVPHRFPESLTLPRR
ncbi:hypothetical protein E1A91_A03G145900v1 [Gossypium mustelinum]|uniref:Uncharacterized protein n=1 Tax=Gossypium mustelinum TaxID=34275 RepID=A0A5D2ZW35_GOSMU|nr:hypothetical protein E1A91_A03G145900v1 [Gossypium mustelinum]